MTDRFERQLPTLLREGFLADEPPAELQERVRGRMRRRAARGRAAVALCAALLLGVGAIGVPRLLDELRGGEVDFVAPPERPAETETPAAVSHGPGWTELAQPPLATRDGAAVVWGSGRVLVWGGVDAVTLHGDGAVSDAVSGQWRPLPPAPISPRTGATGVWDGERVLVWGGWERDPALPEPEPATDVDWLRGAADGAMWDSGTGQWTPIPPAPVPGRGGHGAVWADGELLVWGGQERPGGRPHADGASFDPATGRWRTLPDAPLGPRANHVMAWADGELVIWGGDTGDARSDGDWRHYDDGAAYEPASDRWRPLPPAPIGMRGSSQHAWTGRLLLVVGGASSDGFQPDAAAYDPRRDAWQPIAQPALPDGLGVGPWTGSQLLRWVRDDRVGLRGASWHALADRWEPLEAPPAMGLRDLPAVVWDGQTALLYTGAEDQGFWRYEPSAARPSAQAGDRDGLVAARPGALVVLDGAGVERFTLAELGAAAEVRALAVRPGSTLRAATVAAHVRIAEDSAVEVFSADEAGPTQHVPYRELSGHPLWLGAPDDALLPDPVWDPEGEYLAWLEPQGDMPAVRLVRWTGERALSMTPHAIEPGSVAGLRDVRLTGWQWEGSAGGDRTGALLLSATDDQGRPVTRRLAVSERDGDARLEDPALRREPGSGLPGQLVARAGVAAGDDYQLTADLTAWPDVRGLRLFRVVDGGGVHELVVPADVWPSGDVPAPALRARDGQVLLLDHAGRLLWVPDRGPDSGAVAFEGSWTAADLLR